ncbi:hypothetical protein PVK06_043350 [Gossypium arboreum]|uniref:Uncharacterized protein n=1 Tax=Gossypium arboreum TaxID=29729 RepID=A0ABR0MN75_GOSAR|nr:hypothetical protein PVK06_043350 [Gossypium arboreum]
MDISSILKGTCGQEKTTTVPPQKLVARKKARSTEGSSRHIPNPSTLENPLKTNPLTQEATPIELEIPKLNKFDCKAIDPTYDSEEKVWDRFKAQEERHKAELKRLCQSHGETFKKYQEDTQKKLVEALLNLKSNLIPLAQVAIGPLDLSKVNFNNLKISL